MPSSKVVLLILFLAGGLAALLLARRELAREARDPGFRAQQQLGALQMGIERFNIDTGRYPTPAEGTAALVSRPYTIRSERWRGPYLEGGSGDPLTDPWNRPYRYRVLENGRGMAYTLGADDAPGGTGENGDLMGISGAMRQVRTPEERSGSAFDTLLRRSSPGADAPGEDK